MSDVASAAPSAGWYDDPADPARLRWWNGAEWTDRGMTKEAGAAPEASLTEAARPGRLATVTPITAAMAPPPAGSLPALALPVPADPQSDVPPTAVPMDVTGLSLPAPQGPSGDSPLRQLALAPDPAELAAAAGDGATGEQELAALLAARKAQLGLGGAQPAPNVTAAAPPARDAAEMQMFFPGQTPTAPPRNPLLDLGGPEAFSALPAPVEVVPEPPAPVPSRRRREKAVREPKPPREKAVRDAARASSDAVPRGLRRLWNGPTRPAPAVETVETSSTPSQAKSGPIAGAAMERATPAETADLAAKTALSSAPVLAAPADAAAEAAGAVAEHAEPAPEAAPAPPVTATDSAAVAPSAPRGRRAAVPQPAASAPRVTPAPASTAPSQLTPSPAGPPLRAPRPTPAPTGPALGGAAPRLPVPSPLGALAPGSVIQPVSPAASEPASGDTRAQSISSRGAWWIDLLPRTSNTGAAWLLSLVPLGVVAAAAAVAWVALAHPRWILLALGIAAVGIVLVPILLVANDHARLRSLGWERQPRALSILLGSVSYLLARQLALGRQGARVLPLTIVTIAAAILALAGLVGGAIYGQDQLQEWVASARAYLMI